MEKTLDLMVKVPVVDLVDEILRRAASGTLTASAPSSGSKPPVGAFWEGEGGIYLGEIVGENGMPGGPVIGCIDPSGIFENVAYGHYGETVPGADWRRDGRANTEALAKAGNEFATKVLGLTICGKKDWHWPAQCELNLAFINGGDHYAKEAHWSSTQDGADNARCQNFEDGISSWLSKGYRLSAFVVRRVP